MRYLTPVILSVLLSACVPTIDDTDDSVGGDSSGSEEGGEDTVDTGDVIEGLTNFDFRIHDEIESLVYVSWTADEAGSAYVEYSFDEDEWLQSPEQDFDAGDSEQLLLGIPYNTVFSWRLVWTSGDETQTIGKQEAYTGDLPNIPEPSVLISDSDRYESSGKYLMGSINGRDGGWVSGNYWKFIMDRQGRIVWASLTPQGHWSIYLQPSYDGTSILWDQSTYWSDWDGGDASQVHRMKIDGTILESVNLKGEHHVFRELADGSLVWGAAQGSSETLEKLNPDGTQETIWNCRDFHGELDVSRSCQSNTLYWHEPTDTFLFSFYTTNTVVEIDHQSGKTLRQWGGDLPQSWDFDPANSVFEWQHGANYTETGTMLLSTEVPGEWETAAREYEVDDDSETLVEVWNFGLGEGIYGDTAGEAHRLDNGNTLHNYGSAGHLREVTSEGEIVWEVEWPGNKLLGRTVFLEDLYAFAP